MGLTNPQYEKILREYDKKQIKNRADQEERIRYALTSVPGLRDMEEAVSDLSMQRAKALLKGDKTEADKLSGQLREIRESKEVLLDGAGLPADYMEMQYQCPECKDTGYIGDKKCRCFRQAIVNVLFSQYSIHDRLEKENFDTFLFDYFDDSEVDPVSGLTAYENMQMIYRDSREYVENFIPGKENLLFCGLTGTGKTFMSNCIAKALMDKGHSVIYLSAINLFESLASHFFSKSEDQSDDLYTYILDSDLLIIDDLGTELNNSFTSSQLFYCISERALRGKSTIISTNLSMNQIRDAYSERVSSRLLENYRIFRFYNSDIRVKKRLKAISES